MGVHGLLDFIRSVFPQVISDQGLFDSIRVLVDDAMTWLYAPNTNEGKLVTSGRVAWVLIEKVKNYLRLNPGGTYIILFDGDGAPEQKGEERERRRLAFERVCESEGVPTTYPDDAKIVDGGVCVNDVTEGFNPRRLLNSRAGRISLLTYLRDKITESIAKAEWNLCGTVIFDAPTIGPPLQMDPMDGEIREEIKYRPDDINLAEADRRAAWHLDRCFHESRPDTMGIHTSDQDALKYSVRHVLTNGGKVYWINNDVRVSAHELSANLPFGNPQTWLLFCASMGTDYTYKSKIAHYVKSEHVLRSLATAELVFRDLELSEYIRQSINLIHMEFFKKRPLPDDVVKTITDKDLEWQSAVISHDHKPKLLSQMEDAEGLIKHLTWLIRDYWGLSDIKRGDKRPRE